MSYIGFIGNIGAISGLYKSRFKLNLNMFTKIETLASIKVHLFHYLRVLHSHCCWMGDCLLENLILTLMSLSSTFEAIMTSNF